MVGTIITILTLMANWMIFKKMGRQGWESLIPFYNLYVLFDLLYGEGIKFLFLLIPFYNIYVFFKLFCDLAFAFNRSAWYGIGLVFFPYIFAPLLAFSEAEYEEGVYANEEDDFVSEAVDQFKNFANKKHEARNHQPYQYRTHCEDNLKSGADARATYEAENEPHDSDIVEEIADLSDLFEDGVISESEYETRKSQLLDKM